MKESLNMKQEGNEGRYNQLYQKAFDLSIEWGDYWGKMVNERIKKIYPGISDEEIDNLNKECKQIQQYGSELSTPKNGKKISQKEFTQRIKARYPRLSAQNIEKLINHKPAKSDTPKHTKSATQLKAPLKNTVSFFMNIISRNNKYS